MFVCHNHHDFHIGLNSSAHCAHSMRDTGEDIASSGGLCPFGFMGVGNRGDDVEAGIRTPLTSQSEYWLFTSLYSESFCFWLLRLGSVRALPVPALISFTYQMLDTHTHTYRDTHRHSLSLPNPNCIAWPFLLVFFSFLLLFCWWCCIDAYSAAK